MSKKKHKVGNKVFWEANCDKHNVSNSCADCTNFYHDNTNRGFKKYADPECMVTTYHNLNSFPFMKTKCKKFKKRNCC